MKPKIFYLIFIITFIYLLPLSLFSQETGDVNNDSTVDIIDALLVAQYYVGLNPGNFSPDVADVNCDSSIDIVDALLIAQYYVGLVTEFSECDETPSPTPMSTSIPPPPTPTPGSTDLPYQIILHLNVVDDYASEEGPDSARLSITEEFINIAADGWTQVSYSISGTATNGVDYDELSGTVWVLLGMDLGVGTPPPGEPREYIDITPIDDTAVEGHETVTISIKYEGLTYADDQETITIVDDESGTLPPTPEPTPTQTPGPTPIPIPVNENIEWQNMTGGNDVDIMNSISTTSDNGYIIAGYSNSTDIPGTINNESTDCYIIKCDSIGNIEWQKMIGGSYRDTAASIEAALDNGYIFVGTSSSPDIVGCINHGGTDYYIVKLDLSGNIEWQKMIGGSDEDLATSVQVTPDNGYIVAGTSASTDIEGCIIHGDYDCYLVKLDSNGNIKWQTMIGGSGFEEPRSIQVTSDNGYVFAGYSSSTDIEGCTRHGVRDFYIVKMDASGNIEWQTMIGGNNGDTANSMQVTPDGYVIAGYSNSTDIQGYPNHGSNDIYIVKLDTSGNGVWQKMMGGISSDGASSVQVMPDNCFIVAGHIGSGSIGGYATHGSEDFYIVKLNSDGTIIWHSLIGGSEGERAHSLRLTYDNNIIITGYSQSTDILGCINHGSYDCYIVKLYDD